MTITWDPKYAIGEPEVDAQHQELFRRADQLLRAIQMGCATAEVERVMTFVGDYVHLHFSAEEALMRGRSYPQLGAHQVEHRVLIKALVELKRDLATHGPTPEFAARLGAALVDWLRDHITTSDQAFGLWLQAQAAAPPRPAALH